MEKMLISALEIILDSVVYALVGLAAAWYYYYRKNKDLLGGFWGAAVIGTLGSVIIARFAGKWFIVLINWMMIPKEIYGPFKIRVNLLAALLGAVLFVYILNRINHDRERQN